MGSYFPGLEGGLCALVSINDPVSILSRNVLFLKKCQVAIVFSSSTLSEEWLLSRIKTKTFLAVLNLCYKKQSILASEKMACLELFHLDGVGTDPQKSQVSHLLLQDRPGPWGRGEERGILEKEPRSFPRRTLYELKGHIIRREMFCTIHWTRCLLSANWIMF